MSRTTTQRPAPALEVGPLLCGWTVWGASVTLGVTHGTRLHAARLLLEEWIAGVDRACNRFDPDSELSRCNRSSGAWVSVGPMFLDALEVALGAAAASGGTVDPTVCAALVALGYDRDFDLLATRSDPGSSTEPARARPLASPVPGWHRVEVDRANGRVRLPPGVQLDLGATAKAWCVDRAAEAIGRLGVGVLVGIGGDLAVSGPPPAGGWRVTVQESSRVTLDDAAPVVSVVEGAIASSGTSVRTWTHRGRLVHHIIDPRTSQPARPVWQLVTVAAPTCVAANVSATDAIVRGAAAVHTLERDGRPARLVDHTGRVVTVGGWPEDRIADDTRSAPADTLVGARP
ncbi:MAG: FAD:protein FMN transferase [Acidimicrobiales bacterium]|nr:FAD:protein FMN transferase [Acidimicrobiales bacterium]